MLLVAIGTGQGTLIKPLQGIAGGVQSTAPKVSFTTVTSKSELDPLLEQARLQQVPVMLDFYADWCVSCKELEVFTFADAGVAERLGGFMTIKVDVTAHDDAAKQLYKDYQLIGPPALIFYDRSGERLDSETLIGVPDPDDFFEHLDKIAGASI